MSGRRTTDTLEVLLTARRRSGFVARGREIDAFRAALDAVHSRPSVLHVHGPGGIGKTALLDMFAAIAEQAAVIVICLDGHHVAPVPTDVLDVIRAGAGIPADREIFPALGELPAVVLLVDTYERLAPLDDWFRDRLLPRLPAAAVVVIAGRQPPSSAWLSDAAWEGLTRVLRLRNLDRADSEEYLRRRGLDEEPRRTVAQVAGGHPLGLALLADLVRRGDSVSVEAWTPDLLGSLVRRFLDATPDPTQRRALEVCALARVTSEGLLRDALELDDAHEVFDWLRGLSFVESGPGGVFPHDLARDALDADLRWRDAESYQRLFRGIQTHVIGRLKTTRGPEQQRVLLDAKYMHRHQPISRVMADWDSFGQNYLEPAADGDRTAVLGLIGSWEGAESVAIAERWWRRQPGGFQVVRGYDGQIQGVLVAIDLVRADREDIAADPGARAAWEVAAGRGALRAGEAVTQLRFVVDRDAYQSPSPTVNLAPVLTIQSWLATPNVALGFITLTEPERWEDYFAFFEIHRAAGADFTVNGSRFGLFVRDFRRIPLDSWLNLMFERDLTGDDTVETSAERESWLALSEADFGASVRAALRDWARRDRLATNPLLRSRLLVAGGDGSPTPDALRALIVAAVEQLRDHPRDEKLYRVLDRTYLHPAATQERAAEVLDLPMSTYKRHLRRGIERVVNLLWQQELGPN